MREICLTRYLENTVCGTLACSFTQFISFNPHSPQKEILLFPHFSDEEVFSADS